MGSRRTFPLVGPTKVKAYKSWSLKSPHELEIKNTLLLFYTVGVRIPNMLGFWMVDGVRISNGQPFFKPRNDLKKDHIIRPRS